MKKKRSILHDLLFVSISSFIVVVAWIGFNLYHTWVTTTLTPEMQVQITKISPDFDMATLQKLQARKKVIPITVLTGKTIVETGTPPSPTAAPQGGAVVPTGTAVIPTPTSVNAVQPQPKLTDIPVTVQGE